MNNKIFLVMLLLLCGCATQNSLQNTIINNPKEVSVAKRNLKRKVAIARFSNESKFAKSIFNDGSENNAGKQATDILSSKLSATGKFVLLERSDLKNIVDEVVLSQTFSNKEINLNVVGADYLIVGSISEFGRKEVGDVGVFTRSRKQIAYAKVYIRLIDTQTSQIIFSANGEGEAALEASNVVGLGDRMGYDATLNDKAISNAIDKMVDNIVAKLTDKPWRSYILQKINDNVLVIAGGKAQGIMQNDVFNVYSKGEKVLNPQTNMYLELPGDKIATVRVDKQLNNDSANEISIVSIKEGSIKSFELTDMYIEEAVNSNI